MGGSFYAVSTSDNPGTHALLQDFSFPLPAVSLVLSFQMFVNDQSGVGPAVDPTGLDHTTGGMMFPNDNQHARADILRGGASDFSTAPADVLANLYLGVDNPGGIPPNPYVDYVFDLAGLLGPGTYRLRFAEVDNLSAMNLGVDNVNLRYTPIPEPGSLALLALAAGPLAMRLRRRARPATDLPAGD